MRATVSRAIDHAPKREQCRYRRIERTFSAQRQAKKLVLDLLRAHSGG